MATVPRRQRYYEGATTSCSACPSAYGFASRVHGFPHLRVRSRAPGDLQASRRAGVFVGHAGRPPSSGFPHGQEQDLTGSLATLPVALRLSKTPDDPSHLASRGASGAASRPNTLKASSVSMISRLTEPLHHTLSTLHDGRCRTPCKTRFRLAGCAFAGRESNPLGSVGRCQIISSSSPGLRLALGQHSTPVNRRGSTPNVEADPSTSPQPANGHAPALGGASSMRRRLGARLVSACICRE